MRSIRFSIAGLMGAVLIAAICSAALVSASDTWAGVAILATCGILSLAVVGVVCRDATERPWWLGFALFGWGYMALEFLSPFHQTTLPTMMLIDIVREKAGRGDPAPGFGVQSFTHIANCFWALLAAILGGILATALFAMPAFRSERSIAEPQDTGQLPRTWWRRPVVIGESGLAITGTLAMVTSGLPQLLWAGLIFLMTCVLLGFTVLGALLVRGRGRELWLGAALFGCGYVIMAFELYPFQTNCPHLVTGRFLSAIRPWFPSSVSGLPDPVDRTNPANVRILKMLEQPVPMRFNDTQFEAFLKSVTKATASADGPGIPFYIEPIGLHEGEKSLTSTITMDLEGVPLRTTLNLCLKQLGLMYKIKEGYLIIVGEYEIARVSEDPFRIVGHSLLALFAAGFGGAAAPLIVGWKNRT